MTTDATLRPWQWWGAKKIGDDSRFIGGPHPFESEAEARNYFGNHRDVRLIKVFDEGECDTLRAQLAAANERESTLNGELKSSRLRETDLRLSLAESHARVKRLEEALQWQGAKDSDGYCFCNERHIEENSDHMGLRFHSEHCLKTRAALAAKEGE